MQFILFYNENLYAFPFVINFILFHTCCVQGKEVIYLSIISCI